jgi:hypothetical protein
MHHSEIEFYRPACMLNNKNHLQSGTGIPRSPRSSRWWAPPPFHVLSPRTLCQPCYTPDPRDEEVQRQRHLVFLGGVSPIAWSATLFFSLSGLFLPSAALVPCLLVVDSHACLSFPMMASPVSMRLEMSSAPTFSTSDKTSHQERSILIAQIARSYRSIFRVVSANSV